MRVSRLFASPSLKTPLLFLLLSFFFLAAPFFKVHADIDGLVAKINQYRISKGLGALTEDQNLTNAACWLASDNAKQGKSQHADSLGRDMSSRLSAFGVIGVARAENVAAWTDKSLGASYAFDLWKNSAGHNKNMLGGYTRIGVGQAFSGSWRYVVADFASGSAVKLSSQCGTPVSSPAPPANPTNNPAPSKPASAKPATVTNPLPTPEIKKPNKISILLRQRFKQLRVLGASTSEGISSNNSSLINNTPGKVKETSFDKRALLIALFLILLSIALFAEILRSKFYQKK